MANAPILSSASNHAIVQLPGRKFPGSVIQGDSLSILYSLACDLEDGLKAAQDSELRDTAAELRELLEGRLRHYDGVLEENGLPRPYQPPRWRSQGPGEGSAPA